MVVDFKNLFCAFDVVFYSKSWESSLPLVPSFGVCYLHPCLRCYSSSQKTCVQVPTIYSESLMTPSNVVCVSLVALAVFWNPLCLVSISILTLPYVVMRSILKISDPEIIAIGERSRAKTFYNGPTKERNRSTIIYITSNWSNISLCWSYKPLMGYTVEAAIHYRSNTGRNKALCSWRGTVKASCEYKSALYFHFFSAVSGTSISRYHGPHTERLDRWAPSIHALGIATIQLDWLHEAAAAALKWPSEPERLAEDFSPT